MNLRLLLLMCAVLSSAGCTEYLTRGPAQYCVASPGRASIARPAEERSLIDLAKAWNPPANSSRANNYVPKWDKLSKSAWFRTDQDELVMCRHSIYAEESCENQYYTFTKINGKWAVTDAREGLRCLD